jgi:hypothetical protein
MNEKSPPAILSLLHGTRYYPESRLVTWHPRGVLDDELADRIVEFLEFQESVSDVPFHRYTDFNGFTKIQLNIDHVFQIAAHRRTAYEGGPVKSAFFSDWMIGLGIARLYEELMRGGPIDVRTFRTREAAAEWLDVPVSILHPPAATK